MGHLEGNFMPVLYMGRKVPKGYTGVNRIHLAAILLVKPTPTQLHCRIAVILCSYL